VGLGTGKSTSGDRSVGDVTAVEICTARPNVAGAGCSSGCQMEFQRLPVLSGVKVGFGSHNLRGGNSDGRRWNWKEWESVSGGYSVSSDAMLVQALPGTVDTTKGGPEAPAGPARQGECDVEVVPMVPVVPVVPAWQFRMQPVQIDFRVSLKGGTHHYLRT
jgi:hypothetical protein